MSEPRPAVLVVEDEPEIRRFVRSSLAAEGYRVVEAANGERGAIDAASHKPDMAIVDLGLPDMDGVEVIRRIRGWSTMPILVLSARIEERSKIDALDAGADDYITKPFGVGELLARVRVALRHVARSASGEAILILENANIDLQKRQRRAPYAAGVQIARLPRQAHRHGGDAPAAAEPGLGADARRAHTLPARVHEGAERQA